VNKDLELLSEENAKNLKNLEMQRETNKKLQTNLKDLEIEKKEEKHRYLKAQELLRDKEKDVLSKEETIKRL
jgi:peptidoglycan hydrolase CwlO-like protein